MPLGASWSVRKGSDIGFSVDPKEAIQGSHLSSAPLDMWILLVHFTQTFVLFRLPGSGSTDFAGSTPFGSPDRRNPSPPTREKLPQLPKRITETKRSRVPPKPEVHLVTPKPEDIGPSCTNQAPRKRVSGQDRSWGTTTGVFSESSVHGGAGIPRLRRSERVQNWQASEPPHRKGTDQERGLNSLKKPIQYVPQTRVRTFRSQKTSILGLPCFASRARAMLQHNRHVVDLKVDWPT